MKKGYGIFEADYMNGALHIERLDNLMLFETDEKASQQAEKDGIKIIHNLPIDEFDEDYAFFIDNEENREIIKKHLLTRGIEWNIENDNIVVDTDRQAIKIWKGMENVPFDSENEILESDYFIWKKGELKSTIWAWFNENYSMGLSQLWEDAEFTE